MENQKNGKGKTVAIVILIVLLLGAVGYIAYNQFNNGNDNETTIQSYKEENKTLKNEIESLKNEKSNGATNPFETLVGTWTYKSSYDMGDGGTCDINVKLDMKENGTFTYENTATCGGGTIAKGTYALGKDKIYLHNENCGPVIDGTGSDKCTYPNCEPIIEINYKDGKMTTSAIGGRVSNLELNK